MHRRLFLHVDFTRYEYTGRYLLCCVRIGLDWIQLLGHQLDWTGLESVAREFGLDCVFSTQSIYLACELLMFPVAGPVERILSALPACPAPVDQMPAEFTDCQHRSANSARSKTRRDKLASELNSFPTDIQWSASISPPEHREDLHISQLEWTIPWKVQLVLCLAYFAQSSSAKYQFDAF